MAAGAVPFSGISISPVGFSGAELLAIKGFLSLAGLAGGGTRGVSVVVAVSVRLEARHEFDFGVLAHASPSRGDSEEESEAFAPLLLVICSKGVPCGLNFRPSHRLKTKSEHARMIAKIPEMTRGQKLFMDKNETGAGYNPAPASIQANLSLFIGLSKARHRRFGERLALGLRPRQYSPKWP